MISFGSILLYQDIYGLHESAAGIGDRIQKIIFLLKLAKERNDILSPPDGSTVRSK